MALVHARSHFPLATVPQNAGPLTEVLSQAIKTVASLHDIATIDRRGFSLIRPRHVSAFRLLPEVLA
ncbi:hypothetical protein [Streptosporangium sp. NPDC004631]